MPPHSSEAQPGKVYARTVSDVPGAVTDTNPNEDEFLTCGSCGYLNPGDAKVCAKCRFPLGVPARRAEPIIDERSLAEQPAPDPAPEVKASFRATVDPYRKGIVVENNCRLRLVVEALTGFHIYLEEKNLPPTQYKDQKLESKGFLPEIYIQDFPIRNQRVTLCIKRRSWEIKGTGKIISIIEKHINLSKFANGFSYRIFNVGCISYV